MLISLVNLDFVDMSKIDYGADYKRIIMRLKLKMDYFCRSPGILYFNIINYLFYPQIKIDLNDINYHLIVFSLMRFCPILLYYFSSLKYCYVPHCRESQDPLSHKIPPLHIISRSVKVLPFLASLMSFHQRVFLTRQIVFGEFFYAFFFFFLCARLLLFLFTHFCVFCACF